MTLTVIEKKPGNLSLSNSGLVKKYDNDRIDDRSNYVEIGYMVVQTKVMFDYFIDPDCSFSTVIKSMANSQKIILESFLDYKKTIYNFF